MGKKDILARMSRDGGITLAQAQKAFASLIRGMRESLKTGKKINLSGFGSFEVKVREARKGRNPKTGAAVDIPAKRVAYFKPGKELKELINQG